MLVAYVARYGGPEVVELREVPTPEPKPNQIRIRLKAAAVTAGDWRIRSGILPRGFGPLRGLALGFLGPRAAVLGTDAAGVVDAVGSEVSHFAVGDEVLAFPSASLGAHAEFLLMPANGRVARKPKNLSFAEAAALPFGAMTALDFLRRGDVKANERVLINGASGNVGTAALQLCKLRSAHVTAVCSQRNHQLVRSLGADEVVDYQKQDLSQLSPPFDVVIDAVGNAPYKRMQPVLAERGRLLAVLADLPAMLTSAFVGGKLKHKVVAGPCSEKVEDLLEVARLAEAGLLKPVIDQQFPFKQIADAYRVVDSGRKRGSVILTF